MLFKKQQRCCNNNFTEPANGNVLLIIANTDQNDKP